MLNLELGYFIFLLVVGFLFCLLYPKVKPLPYILSYFLFIGYSCVIRYSPLLADMLVYNDALSNLSFSFYYLKEPFFWIFSRLIYIYLDSAEWTFIVYDLIAFIFVFRASYKLRLPNYFPFIFLLFFTSVLGMNNIYRQFLSSCFLLYFISTIITRKGMTKFSFFLSIISHNSSLLFFPIVFFYKRFDNFMKLLSVTLILFSIPIFFFGKSFNASVGSVSGVIYFCLIALFTFCFWILYERKTDFMNKKWIYIGLYFSLLTLVMILFIGSEAQATKRIGMYSLTLLLVPFTILVENIFEKKTKLVARILYYVIILSPSLLFPNSLKFILN